MVCLLCVVIFKMKGRPISFSQNLLHCPRSYKVMPGKYVKGDDAKVHETFTLQLLKLRGVYRTLIDMASERHPSLARPCTSG